MLKLSLPLAGLSVLSLAMALLREMIIAAKFGAGRSVDAYLVAALYPTFISSVFTSVVSGTVVPVFHAAAIEGDAVLQRYTAALWTSSLVVLLIAGVIISVALHPLLSLTAPGFDHQSRLLSSGLAFVMLPGGVMAGLTGCVGAVLNARKSFVVPALVTVVSSAAIAACTLALGGRLGVLAIALGSVVGSAMSLILVWASATSNGIRLRIGPVLGNSHIQLTARLSAPLVLGVVTTYATLFVDRAMASNLPTGSIAALSYADKIVRLPESILMLTIPVVLFSYLAESSAARDLRRMNQLTSLGVVVMVLLLLPVTFVFLLLARPLVTVLFARGVFDNHAVEGTSRALIGYGFGLVFLGLGYVFPRVLMALRQTLTIGLLGCLNVGLKLLLNSLLIPLLAHQGIALASSLMYLITDGAFVLLLWRAGIRVRLRVLLTALLAGTFAGLAIVGAAHVSDWFSWSALAELAMGAVGGLLAILVMYRLGVLRRLLEEGERDGSSVPSAT